MRLPALVPALLLSATFAVAASAQQTTAPSTSTVLPIVPGARVKVSASTLVSPLLANYLETKGDTAVFIEAGAGRGIWTFTIDQITKLEQSLGEKRNNPGIMLKAGAIGVPIGALAFWGTTGIIKTSDSTTKFNRGSTALAGALVGGAVGAIIGSRFTRERWMAIPLPRRLLLNPFRRDGMEIGIGYTF